MVIQEEMVVVRETLQAVQRQNVLGLELGRHW